MAMTPQQCQLLYSRAWDVGAFAANAFDPQPMTVVQKDPVTSEVKKKWHVPEGMCGFAWVIVRPGNCRFANWLKKNKLADKSHKGGVMIWIGDYNQSYERKRAHANAMAKFLRDQGINAVAESRLD